MNKILITSYVNPDLDGIACCFAYAELLHAQGKDVVAGYFGEPSHEARYVLDRFQIPYPQKVPDCNDFNSIILVDVSNVSDLEGHIPLERVGGIIDHRKVHEADKFPNASVQIELVGSAATLVAEKFQSAGIAPSQSAAILMVSAIISNTFNFQAKVTADRDRNMYAWLLPVANLSPNYAQELFVAKSDMSGERLKNVLIGDLGIFDFGQYHVGIAQIEMIGGFELLQNRKIEILSILEEIKKAESLDWIYCSIVELEKGCVIFVAQDEISKKALHDLFSISFGDDTAVRQGLIMRKEAAALLKEYFENT